MHLGLRLLIIERITRCVDLGANMKGPSFFPHFRLGRYINRAIFKLMSWWMKLSRLGGQTVTMNDSKIENRLRRMELSLAKCCNDASRPRDFFKNKAVDHSTTVLWMLLDEYIKEKVFSYKECGGHVARPNYRGLWLAVIRARKRDWWACWSVRFPVADGSESSWYISITASAAELFL